MELAARQIIVDLLKEFRIDGKCLEVMAHGYSPNIDAIMDFSENEEYAFTFPVLQLSSNIAERILELNLDYKSPL